jgi:hypothetical protein
MTISTTDKNLDKLKVIPYGYNLWTKGWLPLEIDPINRGLHCIESEHHEIHESTSFTAYYTVTTAATDAHRSGLFIKTPPTDENTERVHMLVSFAASTAANFSICEAPTIAANIGTHTGIIYNRFRDSSRISKCKNNATVPLLGYYTTLTEAQIAADGTWATGTVIRTEPLRVGDAPKPAGGSSRGTQEYILKADTKYVFLITNTAASANTHFILIDWYEHRTLAH